MKKKKTRKDNNVFCFHWRVFFIFGNVFDDCLDLVMEVITVQWRCLLRSKIYLHSEGSTNFKAMQTFQALNLLRCKNQYRNRFISLHRVFNENFPTMMNESCMKVVTLEKKKEEKTLM